MKTKEEIKKKQQKEDKNFSKDTHLNEKGELSSSPPKKELAWINDKLPKHYERPKKSFPFMITKRCNMSCEFCAWRNHPKWNSEFLDAPVKFFEQTIKKMKKASFNSCHLIGGEVCCHPNFKELIDILVKHKVKFTLVTNSKQWEKYKFLLEEPYNKYFSSMAFSLDGKPETHDKYRGKGSYNKVIEAINYFSGKKPFSIKMVLRRDNYQDIEYVYEIFKKYYKEIKNKKLKPDFEAFDCQVSPDFILYQPQVNFIFDFMKKKDKELLEYGNKKICIRPILLQQKGLNFCPALNNKDFFVLTDGKVGFCCSDFGVMKPFGNINNESVEELLRKKCDISLWLLSKIFPYLHSDTPIVMKDSCALCRHFGGCDK